MKRAKLFIVILLWAVSSQCLSDSLAAANGKQYDGNFKLIDARSPAGGIGWFAESMPPPGMWVYPMFESLITVDSKGNVVPLLATDWELSADMKSITFILRKDVKFHDGSILDSDVVKWNLEQFIHARLASAKLLASVDRLDEFTIRVNLKEYANTVLMNISSIPMISKAAFEKNGKEGVRWNPVGTGPFKFESYTRDTSMKFTRFSGYWQQGKPYLDAIEILFIVDPLTASAAFDAGEADALAGDASKALYDLQQKKYRIDRYISGAITLIPDSKNADSPLSNRKVREAIDYAINREAIVKTLGFDMWVPTYQFALPNSSAYIRDLPARTYDPEKAKKLLSEAGYPSGFKIKIIGDSSSTSKDATVAVQGFLSKVGIYTQLEWVDFAGFVQYVMRGWNNALLACTNGFSANLNSSIDFVWSQKAMFFPSISKTDELQELLQESLSSREYDEVKVQKVLGKMHDDAMFIPLYCVIRGLATKPYVHDTGFSTGSGPFFWSPSDTWIEK